MQVMQFAQLDGVSECTFFSMGQLEVQRVQLLPLNNLAFMDERTPSPLMTAPGTQLAGSGATLLQGPRQRGWRRVGLISLPEARAPSTFIASGRPAELVSTQQGWMLFFDWRAKKYKSAWVAFLKTQEKIRPQNMSLLPQFILPLIFLTQMQDRFESGLARRWLAHFDYSYRHTFDLIVGLFGRWVLEQRTPAAQRQYAVYAASGADMSGLQSVMTPAQQAAMETFERHFNTQFEATCTAQRWEAALIRALNEASGELWYGQEHSDLPDNPTLKALLPLALWQSEPDGPVEAVLQAGPDRMGDVWRWWRAER